eukprot:3134701-Pyramimonas_sp.AAC.1
MGEDEPAPSTGSAPTVEQSMADQLRQVSAQGSEPPAEPRPAGNEEPTPTETNQAIPDDDDADLLPQPEQQEAPAVQQPPAELPDQQVTDSRTRFREMRRSQDASEMAPLRTFSS